MHNNIIIMKLWGEHAPYIFLWCALSQHLCILFLLQSVDIDECSESTTAAICPRDSQCINTNGSYTCTCNEGYFHLQSLTENLNKCEGKYIA